MDVHHRFDFEAMFFTLTQSSEGDGWTLLNKLAHRHVYAFLLLGLPPDFKHLPTNLQIQKQLYLPATEFSSVLSFVGNISADSTGMSRAEPEEATNTLGQDL